jgi:hypothetical protein
MTEQEEREVLDSVDGWLAMQNEIDRLRAALAEILESFTDPEDDNDILRRARAALDSAKDG